MMNNNQMEKLAQLQEESIQFLLTQVDVPVFLTKLANDYNIRPQTEEEAIQLVKIGYALENKLAEMSTAEAAQSSSNTFLKSALEELGCPENNPENNAELVARAAVAANPAVKNAALVAAHTLVSQLQGE